MQSKRQIQRLLQDSILNLCKASLDAGCHFEVDGIICISSPQDDQQIVVKMHEFINTPSDGSPSTAHSQSNRSSTHATYGTRGTAAVVQPRGLPNTRRSETVSQVTVAPSQKEDDDGGRRKKVKVFEIVDEPVETQSPADETNLLWSSADTAIEGEEFEVLTDDNIPQEVELAVSKVVGSASKRSSAGTSPSTSCALSAGIVKKAKVTVAHPNKNSPITGPGPYICAGCERQFHTRTSLSLHVVKKHSSYAMVYCGACQTGFIDRKSFSAHSCVQTHPTSEVVDPENDFMDQGGSLDVHSNTMLKSLLTAERMGARLRHADSVAARQPYVIDETDALLDEHSSTSATSAGKQTEQSSRPNSASPSDEQNHNECTVCSKVFEVFEDLEVHCWKAHKRYPCHHCYKTFTEKYTRERHYRIHTGVKPFQCGSCKRGFTRRDHLRTHCDNTHGYPTHLFDLNYKGGEFTPPTDGGASELEAEASAVALSDESMSDAPAVQLVDEFIPLDDVNQEEEEEEAVTYSASVDNTALPVFPVPTEIDHQAEWEEETSSTGPGAASEMAQEDCAMTNGDMEQ